MGLLIHSGFIDLFERNLQDSTQMNAVNEAMHRSPSSSRLSNTFLYLDEVKESAVAISFLIFLPVFFQHK